MRGRLALAAALVFLAASAAAKPAATVAYAVTPELRAGDLVALDVTLTMRADGSGTTVLDLPDRSDGHSERWRFISDIVAEGASIREDGPAKRILSSKPGARIKVGYRVHSAYAQDPDGGDGNPYAGAAVRPTWFSGLGEFVFIAPEGREHAAATFRWGALPKGWIAASDLDAAGKTLTVTDVLNSTMLGGADVKLYARPIPGGQLRVATRGAWSVSDSALTDDLVAVISAQRRFWGDDTGPYFVSAIPLHTSPDHISVGGTGRFAGFALYGTSNAKLAQLRRTLAHEHTHNWIPLRQGRFPDGAQEPSAYWYTEGFTDFYTDRTLLRSGIWTVQDFVGHLNEVLRNYDTSPVREAPISRIVADFWTNPAIYALSYQRGYLLAFLWDAKMQRTTHGATGLDQVMFAMRDRFVKAPANDKPRVVESFAATAQALTTVDVRPDIEEFASRGSAISLPGNLFGACAAVSTVTRPIFDLGFDSAASAAKGVFTGVDPTGPAYKAGIRDGMKRIAREGGEPGNSQVEITYRVADQSGAERVVRYKPEGKSNMTFQQVVLAADTPDRAAACQTLTNGRAEPTRNLISAS